MIPVNMAIDARGRSCPEPVIMTKKVLDTKPQSCEVLVDNQTAAENVTRYAQKAGYSVHVTKEDSDFHLNIKSK